MPSDHRRTSMKCSSKREHWRSLVDCFDWSILTQLEVSIYVKSVNDHECPSPTTQCASSTCHKLSVTCFEILPRPGEFFRIPTNLKRTTALHFHRSQTKQERENARKEPCLYLGPEDLCMLSPSLFAPPQSFEEPVICHLHPEVTLLRLRVSLCLAAAQAHLHCRV